MRRVFRSAAFFCGLLLCALCSAAGPDGGSLATTGAAKKAFTMGFYLPSVRDANRGDLTVSLQTWADTVSQPYGVKVVSRIYEDMAALRKAVERSEVQMVNSSGMELVEAFSLEELGKGFVRHSNGVEEGLVLLVNATSGIHRFDDLRGKKIVRLSNDRLSDVFLESQCLKASGSSCREFAKVSEEKQDVQSLYRLFFGKVDAALVSLTTLNMASEMNPQIARRLTGIVEWKAKGLNFGMMTRNADPAIRDMFMQSVGEVIKSPSGRQILELFKTDSVVAVDASDLQPYRELLADYKALLLLRTASRK